MELQSYKTETELARAHLNVGGYSALASFMSSDRIFNIFRRFDSLAIRNILYLQDELSEIEERIASLDEADSTDGSHSALVSLSSRRHDANDNRKTVMAELKVKIIDFRGFFLSSKLQNSQD
jgi:hypothetical protein